MVFMSPLPTLHAHGLTRTFGGRIAIEGISLELKRGEVLGFLGPNGAGKSTTMQMLTGNLRPDSGTVRICDIDLFENPVAAKMRLGYLPQTPPLYPDMSVDDYLKFVAKLHRSKKDALEETRARCGLSEVGKRLIGSLSKGFQQRVGIAQAIIHQPDVIILDEPTAGLDPNQIREVRLLIRELGDMHSVILSTHILSEVESICDRVEILHRGKPVYSGDIEGLGRSRFVEVGFRNPPSPEALGSIEGVSRVEALSPDLIRLHHAPDVDPTESVIRMASGSGWGLQRINPAKSSLEEVFAALTQDGGQS